MHDSLFSAPLPQAPLYKSFSFGCLRGHRKRPVSKTIEWQQEIIGKAAIQMFNKSANFANCLAACRIAITLLAGMADREAMVRAIADDLTSLRGILVEAPAGQHPASKDILAEPEAMPAEHKDSIEAIEMAAPTRGLGRRNC